MGGNRISKEVKEKVLELLVKGYRCRIISQKLNLTFSTVKKWQYLFDGGDTSWVEKTFTHYSVIFSEKEKTDAVFSILSENKLKADVCREMCVSIYVLNLWIFNYTNYGVCTRKRGRTPKEDNNDRRTEEDQRTREITQRERERNSLLENTLPGLGRRVQEGRVKKKVFFETINRARKVGIPVKESLRIAGVSSSNYYYWLKHKDKFIDEEERLAEVIRREQEANYWEFGAKTMAKHLVVKLGLYEALNHKKVARIMKKYKLNAKVRRLRYPKDYYKTLKENTGEKPANILNRDFKSDEPGMKTVTDLTYIPTVDGWAYLAAIKDLYNNEIIGWKLEKNMSVQMTLEVIEDLLNKGTIHKGSLIHSDQGWNYTQKQYINYLSENGFVQSMSRRGNCWDNACMENFFGFLKCATFRQMTKKGKDLTFDEAKMTVDNYINWYNNERIQKKLGYMSPVEYRLFK